MKIYATPANIPFPEQDWSKPYDANDTSEQDWVESVKNEMFKLGWTGLHSGEIIRFGVADGHASYMYFSSSHTSKAGLIHLPLGDAYQYRDVEFLPKREILKRLKGQAAMAKLFGHR